LPQEKFNRVLLDAIEGGLSSLGNSQREAIFYHLKASFRLKKENIPLNLSEFHQALEEIFGPGSPYLEKVIVRCLYERLGLGFEEREHVDLVVCVNDAKRRVTREEEVKQYG
jgi:hypothetical protein